MPGQLRPPTGAAPDAIALHVPRLPPRLHAPQLPAHGALQQYPSTQLPLVHSVGPPHVRPLGFVVLHVASALQKRALAQSASVVHDVIHAVPAPLHLKLPHDVVPPALQAPAPLQLPWFVCVPALHDCMPQLVALAGKVHAVADAAVHVPPHVVPLPAQSPRMPCGCPLVTCEHTPSDVGKSHAWHLPLQSLLQQVPSTQWSLVHSLDDEQLAPSGLVPQLIETQVAGALQSPMPLHVVLHAVFALLHANGVHTIEFGVTHAPAPSQRDALVPVFVPGSHVDGLHSVVSFHNRQAP